MTDDQPGHVVARKYELIAPAGTGGMAHVWRARTIGAAGFSRPVALKRLLAPLAADAEFVKMFVEEARVVSALQHPNIVQIHDFGLDEQRQYFLVMEWVEGVDLLDWARGHAALGRRTPWHLATAIGIEVLKGLTAAHERADDRGGPAPVFHRDVTPHNILIGLNGIVKLSDFGLARAMDRGKMTRPNIVKGKIAYLAPEIAEGAEASARTDLFSVGIVLWEALAARKLFTGKDHVELIRRIRLGETPPLSAERPDVPAELAQIVHRALSRDPEARFGSAREMARALARMLRQCEESTEADVIAASVRDARKGLGFAPERELEASLEIPLTRPKPVT